MKFNKTIHKNNNIKKIKKIHCKIKILELKYKILKRIFNYFQNNKIKINKEINKLKLNYQHKNKALLIKIKINKLKIKMQINKRFQILKIRIKITKQNKYTITIIDLMIILEKL